MKLIQFYLDAKFIYNGLVDSLSISDSSRFCKKLIFQIKDYYNLEDIIIIDSISMVVEEYNSTLLRAKIIDYVRKNYDELNPIIQEYLLSPINLTGEGLEYVLYISKLMGKDEGDGLIICVERFPRILNPNEKNSLNNCINLLKTRLYYD